MVVAVLVLFSPVGTRWVGGRCEKVCPGCISETISSRKLILDRDISLKGVGVHHGVALI